MPITKTYAMYTLNEQVGKPSWLSEVVRQIDAKFEDVHWVRTSVVNRIENPTWNIILETESTELQRARLQEMYLNSGWGTVRIVPSCSGSTHWLDVILMSDYEEVFDGFIELDPSMYASLGMLQYEQYMNELRKLARVRNHLIRLTLPVVMTRHDQDQHLEDLDDEFLKYFINKVPSRCIADLSDIIVIKDSAGQTATIKDRRSTGYKVIRHYEV